MKKPVVYSGATCTCTVCGRVLWVEDGPTCVDCEIAQAVAKTEETLSGLGFEIVVSGAEPKPASDVPAPKKRSGCCGSS